MTQDTSTTSSQEKDFFKDFENFLKQTALLFIPAERLTRVVSDNGALEREIHNLLLPYHDAFWIIAQSYAHRLGGLNIEQSRLIHQLESLLPLNGQNTVEDILTMSQQRAPAAWQHLLNLTHQCAEMIAEIAPQNTHLSEQMIELVNRWLGMVIYHSDGSQALKRQFTLEYQHIYLMIHFDGIPPIQ